MSSQPISPRNFGNNTNNMNILSTLPISTERNLAPDFYLQNHLIDDEMDQHRAHISEQI